MKSIPGPGKPVRGSATGRPIMALFDLLGRTWAMGIVWQLEGGPFSFRVLRTRCAEVSPTLLNNRLKELRATGLVSLGPDGYYLTALGEELLVFLHGMEKWSSRWAEALATEERD